MEDNKTQRQSNGIQEVVPEGGHDGDWENALPAIFQERYAKHLEPLHHWEETGASTVSDETTRNYVAQVRDTTSHAVRRPQQKIDLHKLIMLAMQSWSTH